MASRMTTDPNIGHLLSNRYQLVELVGKGAMGRVYRAEDILLGGVIAVKFLSQSLVMNDRLRERFKFEARTCAQLGQKSIHIVRVTDYGINEDDVPFYVMEFLQGSSLSEIISTQTLLLPRFLSLARQICLGLQCAHQGILMDGQLCPIIHRDIKPSNILVSQNALLGELVKILDFGIAKLLQEDGGQTSSFMGTLPYCSPEQMEGQDLDSRSDVYSLGIMMFEMLTGKMPLQAETHTFGAWYKAHHSKSPRAFKSVNPSLKLPNALESLVMGCLEKKSANRPQSIAEVLKALEPLEQRYSANHHIGTRISEALAKKTLTEERSRPVTPSPSGDLVSQAIWPKDKPVAQIVFPQIFSTGKESLATIWVMLPQKEIHSLQVNRIYNRIYKNFLCSMSPHPMVLWLTAIYNRFHSQEQGPRWLRCYLNIKTPFGREMLRLMGERGQYQILLFALEDPPQCAHAITITIHPAQCSLLKQWAIVSQSSPSVGQPSMTKNLLQNEFEKLKPKVVEDLESTSNTSPWA